ncbi:MAG: hypothetical protein AAF591_06495 [Verrucomicrobiota bacterium]
MIKRTTIPAAAAAALLLAFAPAQVFAGEMIDYGKAPPAPVVVEEDDSWFPLYGSVSVGYDSAYMFRGVNLGDRAPWAGLDLNYDINDSVSLNFGTWYINPTGQTFGSDANDELDVYGFLNFAVGPVDLSVGGTGFFFTEAGTQSSEWGLAAGYSLMDFVDLGFMWWADLNAGSGGGTGHYFELAAAKSFDLNDWIAFTVASGVSYSDDYFGVSSWNHVYATGGLTFALTETMAFDAYIGGNWPIGQLKDLGEQDRVYGGASVSVSF